MLIKPKQHIEQIIARVSNKLKFDALVVGQISDDLSMFRKVDVSGSFYKLGIFFGHCAIELGYGFPKLKKKNGDLNLQIIDMYKDCYPQYLKQLQGFAHVYGASIEAMDLTMMEPFFARMGYEGYRIKGSAKSGFKNMCTVIGATGSNGKTYIGRNLDTFNITGFLVNSKMEGVYKTVNTSGEAFCNYVVDGINEKGLFVGEMSIPDPRYKKNLKLRYPDVPSVYCAHMLRIILDTCANVNEAATLLQKVPVWFTNDLWHIYLADSGGSFCIAEWDENGKIVLQHFDKKLIATNTPIMEGDEKLNKCPRYSLANNLINNKDIDSHESIYHLMKALSYRYDNTYLKKLVFKETELRAMKYLRTVWTSTYDLDKLSMIIRYHENG
ncbi:MAG TPA: carcinine hydrolase/isopenicillin-N N-acyltransferase family protein, partial [Spirochaetota bacterium]|nr:carcinine hydrolase/isopenicillin-N N-acyltransferase family protein [Spirochaetota bacterium]